MPRDDQGRWTPEVHRVGYTAKQTEAASGLLSVFERSAASSQVPPIASEKARPIVAAATIQRVLTPLGETRIISKYPPAKPGAL